MESVKFKFDDNGLIPAICQDYHTREVLMLAYMSPESLEITLEKGLATFWSRSRQQLWTKGETSGNFLEVVAIKYDCDQDALLLEVLPKGPACHTGHISCFYRTLYTNEKLEKGNSAILTQIQNTIEDRMENPKEDSYTNYLLSEGVEKICKKVGEEATETVIAAMKSSNEQVCEEAGDLLYHLQVLLADCGLSLNEVYEVLAQRHGKKSEIKTEGKAKRGEI